MTEPEPVVVLPRARQGRAQGAPVAPEVRLLALVTWPARRGDALHLLIFQARTGTQGNRLFDRASLTTGRYRWPGVLGCSALLPTCTGISGGPRLNTSWPK